MKKILMVLTLAFATLFLAQCKKQIVEQPSVTPTGEKVEVSLNVTDDGSKTGISETGIVTWNTNDVLYVVGESDGYLGSISAQNSGSTAYFTGTITKPSTATQNFHFYYTGSQGFMLDGDYFTYDISHQTGKLANIAANLHLMHGIIENVDKNTTNFGTISMSSMMSILQLRFSVASGTGKALGDDVLCTGGFSKIKFNVKNGSFDSDRTRTKKNIYLGEATTAVDGIYYMVVIPGTQTLEFSQGLIGMLCEGPTGGFVANKIYNEKGVSLGELPYLPALFTVGKGVDNVSGTEDDVRIKFSKGNLQYLGTGDDGALTPTWQFGEKQYSYMGECPKTTGSNPNVNKGNVDIDGYSNFNTAFGNDNDMKAARDIFGWGCTGFQDTRAHSNQRYYQPYCIVTESGYGPDANSTIQRDLDVLSKSDWGCLELLPGNSTTKQIWFTLTTNHWPWILGPCNETPTPGTNCRFSSEIGTTNNARFIYAKVDGVCGIIAFPDEFEWPESSLQIPIRVNPTTNVNWNNEYTSAQFSTLEKCGAVFIPAAGNGLGNDYNNSKGYYHTVTSAIGTAYDQSMIFRFLIASDGSTIYQPNIYKYSKSTKCAVRLVCYEDNRKTNVAP